jgi:hypothetical protein
MTPRKGEITRTAHFDDCARSFQRIDDRLVQTMTTSVGSCRTPLFAMRVKVGLVNLQCSCLTSVGVTI